MAAGLYPLRPSAIGSGLGLVLEWCSAPQDLDFWITVPVPAGAGGRPFYSCSQQYQAFNEVLGVWENMRMWFNSSFGYNTEDLCVQAGGEWAVVLPWDDDDNAAVYWDGPKHVVSACPDAGQPGFDQHCQPGGFWGGGEGAHLLLLAQACRCSMECLACLPARAGSEVASFEALEASGRKRGGG